MALFEGKPPKKSQKEVTKTISEVAMKRAVAAARMWVEKNMSDGRLEAQIERRLSDYLERAILTATGLETSFGEVRLKYDSPLNKRISDAAREGAAKILDSFIQTEEKKLPGALPADVRRVVEKAYEASYKDQLIELARERGAKKAEEDIKTILEGLVPTVEGDDDEDR